MTIRRQSFSFKEKADKLALCQVMMDDPRYHKNLAQIATKLGISRQMLYKWRAASGEIVMNAGLERVKELLRGRPTKRHDAVYPVLFRKFEDARTRGKRIDLKWITLQGMQIAERLNGARFTHHAAMMFLRR